MKQKFERGLWTETTHNFRMNFWLIASVVGALLAWSLIQERFQVGRSGGSLSAIIWVLVAMSVHATILRGKAGFAIHGENLFTPFLWRAFLFGGVGLAGMLLTIPLWPDLNRSLVIYPILAVYGFLETILLSKWGTWLPAVIANGDKSFAAAGRRGSKTFGYVLSRLLFGVGSGFLASFILLAIMLVVLDTDGTLWSQEKGFYFLPTLAELIFFLTFSYQIVMVATVLSRAYLIAESTPSNEVPLPDGR